MLNITQYSLHTLDVGFDLRETKDKINLPSDLPISITYLDTKNNKCVATNNTPKELKFCIKYLRKIGYNIHEGE